MRWHNFLYLAPAAVVAVMLLITLAKRIPSLSVPSRRRTGEELVILGVLSAFGLLVIYWNFYVCKTYFVYNIGDVGSDTTEQYYPFYLWLIDSVRNGTLSVWTFEYELGVNLQSFQTWIFDPFNLVLVPLGLLLGNARLSLALVITQTVKLVLSAFLFDHLLTYYCRTPISRLLGSLLYAFSGFMVLYGQHYWMGGALPLFTATILLFERYLERHDSRSFLGATLIVAVQLAWSAYVAFMILLGTALYLLIRIPAVKGDVRPARLVREACLLFAPVVCGLLLACISCVPYANFLLNETARTSSSAPLLERVAKKAGMFVKADWIFPILSRMIGSGLLNTGAVTSTPLVSNTSDIGFVGSFPYEFILLGYSGGFFMLLSQFFHWVIRDCDKRNRVLIAMGTALVLAYCFNEFLPSLFTMMVRTQYRSCFVIALPSCLAMAVGFEKRVIEEAIAPVPLAFSFAVTMVVLIWSLLNTLNGRLVCLYYLVCTVAAFALLLLGADRARTNLTTAALVAVLFSMSVVDGLFTTSCRRMVEPVGVPYTEESGGPAPSQVALAYLNGLDDTFYRVDKDYSDWCPLNDSLIQHYASVSAYNSSPDADVDDFYRNLWDESISTWAVYSQGFRNDPLQPELMSLLNVKYLFMLNPVDQDWLRLETTVSDVYVYENTNNPSLATLRKGVVSEEEAASLPDSAARRELLADYVIVPQEVSASWEGSSSGDSASSPAVFWMEGQSRLTGIVYASDASVVCLSIPFTGSWTITVDGIEVETFRANYGFHGFVVSPGAHEVTASYSIDGLKAGSLLSCIGLIFTAIGCWALRHKTVTV